jgi:dipeptidyl aminopeptidase/acylaminoacyl peptidase
MVRRIVFSSMVIILAGALASATGMTPFQVSTLESVVDVAASPDGARVAFVRSVPRPLFGDDDGPAWRELGVIDVAAGSERVFVGGEVSVSQVHWVPGGRALSFVAKRDGDEHSSLYRIPVDGGEAERIAALGDSVLAYDWSPDGGSVAVIAREPKDDDLEDLREQGFDATVYEEDWRHRRVWIVTPGDADAEPRMLELDGSAFDVQWSPDGDRLAVALAPTPLVDDEYMRQRVHVVAVSTGVVEASVDHAAKLGSIRWSPSGAHLAMIAGVDLNDPSESSLFVVPRTGGAPANLTHGFAGEATDVAWLSDDTLLMLASEGVRTEAYRVDRATGDRRPVGWSAGDAVFTELSVGGAGVFAVGHAPTHPADVFVGEAEGGALERLTDSNPWLADVELGSQEVVRWAARDGVELEGLLIRPLERAADARVPLVVVVHGGPEAHYRNGWVTRYAGPGQVWAARGYAVFYPNYRGSTGRGVEFSKLSQGDPAGAEFDDVVDGVDHLIDIGLVDGDRVGVTGGSYGGYATAWLTTRYSDRFAAGVMFVGISNKISKTGTTDIPEEEFLVHARMRPWDDWQKYLERSPIYWAGQGRTPLLILHGEKDPRVSVTQSREMYRALKTRGETPVRLVLYPDEQHGNRKGAAQFDYMLRLLRWMDHYVVGEGGEMPDWRLDYRATGLGVPADE